MAQDVIINSSEDVRRQDNFEREESAAEVASRIKQYLLKNKLITPEAAKAEDERIKGGWGQGDGGVARRGRLT